MYPPLFVAQRFWGIFWPLVSCWSDFWDVTVKFLGTRQDLEWEGNGLIGEAFPDLFELLWFGEYN